MKIFAQIGFVLIFLFTNRIYAQSDYVEAYYTITVNDSTTHPYPDKKDPEYEISITQVSGFMSAEIMKSRVERYVNNPKTRKECDPLDHCPVLKGYSHIEKYENADFSKPSFEKKYPVMVIKQNKSMGYKYDKKGNEIFTCTYISSSSGSNELDRVVVEVKSFMAPFGILQPLNPSYVIWIEPTGGLYNSTGNGEAYSWDDFESKLMPYDTPSNIDFSNVTFVPDHNLSKSENCTPLLITDYKPFDTFMLKGSDKKYTIESIGSYYSKNESDAGEYFRKIEIKLILNQPYIELAPLDPVIHDENGMPELAPLEPYNPELAPLEPIKK
ncbi:MAG: hypothetical protein IPJ23_14160 [Ignavibacteriales bacterium]|nr:hypothetical protein [Ignavibacteriales bacterium]